MVLINTVTVEAINTALIALQRGQDTTIGGEKGGTVNNINVTNNGTGSGTDVSPQLNALDQRVTEVENENERQNERIAGLEGLGIESVEFEEGSRTLFIYLVNGDVLDVVIPDSPLTLTLNGTTLTLSSDGETLSNVELPFIPSSEKGVAGGVATLDSSGRLPYSQLPESAMEFKGTWNASTNTPHLADGTGTNGDFYVCTMPGTATFGPDNTVSFIQNDRVIYDGATSKWVKLLAGQVSTVNGMSGDVVLNGTNVNYSNAAGSPTLKDKIDAVETKADIQVDWNESNSSSLAFIKNKPTVPAAQVQSDWNESNSSSLAFIKNKPTIPAAQVQSDWTQTDDTQKDFIKNKIPIWIVQGGSSDNMTPIDSVTDGSMRPITSNAVRNGGSAILSALPDWTADPTDTTKLIRRDTGGSASFGQVTFLTLWNYIKSKIQSIALIIGSTTSAIAETLFGSISIKNSSNTETASVSQGGVFTSNQNNNSSWWISTAPRGKFVGTNGGSTTGWSPLLAGKTYTGKYELGSLNKTIYFNYYKDGRTQNGIDKTIFEYTEDGTPQWYGNCSGSSGSCTGNAATVTTSWLLDKIYPVGAVYMSIIHTSPANFLGGTWKEITDGRFLRASGVNAGSVPTIAQINAGTGVQAEGLPNITGSIKGTGYSIGVNTGATNSGALKGEEFNMKTAGGTSTNAKYMSKISFNATDGNSTVPDGATSGNIYGNSSHVTPKNMAVYMWVRTA